jgi:hypothetical protein
VVLFLRGSTICSQRKKTAVVVGHRGSIYPRIFGFPSMEIHYGLIHPRSWSSMEKLWCDGQTVIIDILTGLNKWYVSRMSLTFEFNGYLNSVSHVSRISLTFTVNSLTTNTTIVLHITFPHYCFLKDNICLLLLSEGHLIGLIGLPVHN